MSKEGEEITEILRRKIKQMRENIGDTPKEGYYYKMEMAEDLPYPDITEQEIRNVNFERWLSKL